MDNSKLKNTAYIVISLVLAILSFKGCGDQIADGEILRILKNVVPQDTAYVDRIKRDTVIDTVYLDKFVYLTKEVPAEPTEILLLAPYEDTSYQYRDTLRDDNLLLTYDAVAKDTLRSINFSYQIVRPFQINRTVKETQYINQNGVYVGGGVRYSSGVFDYSVGAYYLNRKNTLYGAAYSPNTKSLAIRAAYKIF